MSAFWNVLSALGGAIIGSLLTFWLSHRAHRSGLQKKHLVSIYMQVLNLLSEYFWIYSSEGRPDVEDDENRKKRVREHWHDIRDISWKIIDKLRALNDKQMVARVVGVLLDENASKYPGAESRYKAIQELAKLIGKEVNPIFQSAIRTVSELNQEQQVRDYNSGNLRR